jgi:hypothetical protein
MNEAAAAASLPLDNAQAATWSLAGVDRPEERGRTALHYAAALGYSDVAKVLVEHGAELTAADADGVTPVDAALGKLKNARGRASGNPHPATAELLQGLLTSAATP